MRGPSCSEAAKVWTPTVSLGHPTASPGFSPTWLSEERRPARARSATGQMPVSSVRSGCRSASTAVMRARWCSAPALGQDTEQVLSELLGVPRTQIGCLHDDGLVAGPA